jgi:hypothetical protein
MSVVNLEDGVTFCPESKEFSKEVGGKVFTSTSFKGVLKQAKQYSDTLDTRESLRGDMIPVSTIHNDVSTQCGKPILYHMESQYLYADLPGGLERIESGDLPWFPIEHLDKAKALRNSEYTLEQQLDEIRGQLDKVRFDVKDMQVHVKYYTKKKGKRHDN